jgi:spore germination cell wall hydrolase CwlJ-like protein
LRANALPRALLAMFTVSALALAGAVASTPANARDLHMASVSADMLKPSLAISPIAPTPMTLRPSFSVTQPTLTNELLEAYVARQQELESFDGFNALEPAPELTENVLLSYIDRTKGTNLALTAIDSATDPSLSSEALEAYAQTKFVPTAKKVKLSKQEQTCLAQAIYHEARGESEAGQLAVANVIINRAFSKKYPSTLCGVIFENADKGRYKCQFTFACDGRPDDGTERRAWNRSMELAQMAYADFIRGERPDVLPASALFYHTTAVSPNWSNSFRPVATIGSHIFYAVN